LAPPLTASGETAFMSGLGGHQTSENWTTPWVPPRLNGDLMESMVIWGFLKMGDRQFTKGFNTKTW